MTDGSFSFSDKVVPRASILCAKSRLGNLYKPTISEICLAEEIIPAESLSFSVEKNQTKPFHEVRKLGIRTGVRSRIAKYITGSLNLKERLVWDARSIDNENIAHLIQHHLAPLSFFRANTKLPLDDLVVVLDAEPPDLAQRVMKQAGLEVVCTDLPVQGNILTTKPVQFYHYLPFLYQYLGTADKSKFPEKVFVSRKASRRIKNEELVSGIAKDFGYEKFYFEELPVGDQWRVLANATHVLGIHGAALGSLGFRNSAHRGVKLCELLPAGCVIDVFRKYLSVLGGNWVGVRGIVTYQVAREIDSPLKYRNHAWDDFSVEPDSICEALERQAG